MKKAFIAAVLLSTTGPLSASDQIEGNWVRDGAWTPINAACTQAWVCVPKQAVIYSSEYRLVGPSRQATIGSCSAGGGDFSSCNFCLISPPDEECALSLKKR